MRILLSGGAGCLGCVTAELLLDAGHEVIVIDDLSSGERTNLDGVLDRITFIEADICDRNAYFPRSGGLDAVIHLAFPTPLCTRDLDKQYYDTAARGTANLLELALGQGAYFVYGSSISVYGVQRRLPIDEDHPTDPILLYGANKLHGETLCRVFGATYGLDYVMLRYSDFYGPADKRANAINAFLTAARDGGRIEIRGGGEQERSYTFVCDAALATVRALERRPHQKVLNVATDTAVSINELAGLVRDGFAPEIEIVRIPGDPDVRHYVFDNTRFAAEVGTVSWTPLAQGLAETFKYLRGTRNCRC